MQALKYEAFNFMAKDITDFGALYTEIALEHQLLS